MDTLEKKNENKYLVFASIDKKTDWIPFHWKINDKSSEYGEDFIKAEFNSVDNLPLNEILKFII